MYTVLRIIKINEKISGTGGINYEKLKNLTNETLKNFNNFGNQHIKFISHGNFKTFKP